jgi:hypothetical protein
MAALGLVILAIASIIALAAGLGNSGSDHTVINFTVLGMDVEGSSGRIFVYGVALGAVGMLGLNMLLAGIGRGFKSKIRNHRELKEEHHHSAELQQERDRLENELQQTKAEQAEVDVREATAGRPLSSPRSQERTRFGRRGE